MLTSEFVREYVTMRREQRVDYIIYRVDGIIAAQLCMFVYVCVHLY